MFFFFFFCFFPSLEKYKKSRWPRGDEKRVTERARERRERGKYLITKKNNVNRSLGAETTGSVSFLGPPFQCLAGDVCTRYVQRLGVPILFSGRDYPFYYYYILIIFFSIFSATNRSSIYIFSERRRKTLYDNITLLCRPRSKCCTVGACDCDVTTTSRRCPESISDNTDNDNNSL